ncbi:MAG: phosphoribosyl transferase [Alphaproteobacteria bacterium]|nr:MAG: phosphoribosyl transferase [Alphaproteobacteria bacterium]
MYFQDRTHAGQELATVLSKYDGKQDTLLLALPRGGVPVAYVIARQLNLPLDVLLVRKLGVPGQQELAMGAIAEDNILYINRDIVRQLDIPPAVIENIIIRETEELNRRRQLYRHDRPAPQIEGKTIIVVDDGLATGATMHAAVNALRQANVKRLIVAVPVGADSTCRELEAYADEVVCLYTPYPFNGVGRWYEDFSQTSDREVEKLLMKARTQSRSYQE